MRIPGLDLLGGDPKGVAHALDALPWRATRHVGIEWLDMAPSGGASQTVLIRMAPGCGYPAHRHIGAEDVLVLAGGYRDGDGRSFSAGEFIRYPAGSTHAPVALDTETQGCVLFAVAHGGTEVIAGEA